MNDDVKLKLNRLEDRILKYEQAPIEKGLILFYGSSGFTRWSAEYGFTPLEDAIRNSDGSVAAVNHGFGYSTTEELLYYYPRLVKPWAPRALVVTEFINDRGFSYSPEEVMFLLKRLLEYARTDNPGVKIYLCDVRHIIKDPIDLPERIEHVTKLNRYLEEYCAAHEDCTLLRHATYPEFYLNPEDIGDYTKVRRDIFVEDQVHFNKLGYEIYTRFFREGLKDVLY